MKESKLRAAILGATGYTGAECLRLLAQHPAIEAVVATSERAAGEPLRQHCPWLDTDLVLQAPDLDAIEADVFFLCQEAGYALANAPALARRAAVVDFSADFRFENTATYAVTYSREHPGHEHPWVYGLPEVVGRSAIAGAQLVANPGCYPTASLIGLKPLVDAGLIEGVPIIDAKSGVSGAGRAKRDVQHLLSELEGSIVAYGLPTHRHQPEIEQFAGPVRFVPHLLPTARGILATIHVSLREPRTAADLQELYRNAYRDEPFVRVQGVPPATKQVRGTNRCDVAVFADPERRTATILSVIDNLVKGAAGQAIQNANLMLGLPEAAGLPTQGVWP